MHSSTRYGRQHEAASVARTIDLSSCDNAIEIAVQSEAGDYPSLV